MAWDDDFRAHFRRALHDQVEIVHLKPQQHSVSIWLVISVADRAMVMLRVETMQLKDDLALENQLLICAAAVIALAAEQPLVPSAACFYVGYGDERLWAHLGASVTQTCWFTIAAAWMNPAAGAVAAISSRQLGGFRLCADFARGRMLDGQPRREPKLQLRMRRPQC